MNSINLLAIFSGIGVAVALSLAVYFFFIRSEDRFSLRLLAILFVAIAIRLAKSVFVFMTEMPVEGTATGSLGLSAIGPTLWLYVKYLKPGERKLRFVDWLHFIPGLISFVVILNSGGSMAFEFFSILTSLLFVYVIASWFRFAKSRASLNEKLRNWNVLVLTTVTVVWVAFSYQLIFDGILNYALGAGLAAIFFYVLLFYALKHPILFPKMSSVTIDEGVIRKLRNALEIDKIYQKQSLTLNRIADELGEPAYVVSKALKAEYGKSFPELINHFRIKDVKEKLQVEKDFVKIEGLAYEVGFSTPSAFYAAFKKETSLSPSEYRKTVLN